MIVRDERGPLRIRGDRFEDLPSPFYDGQHQGRGRGDTENGRGWWFDGRAFRVAGPPLNLFPGQKASRCYHNGYARGCLGQRKYKVDALAPRGHYRTSQDRGL